LVGDFGVEDDLEVVVEFREAAEVKLRVGVDVLLSLMLGVIVAENDVVGV